MYIFFNGGVVTFSTVPSTAEVDEYEIQIKSVEISYLENFVNDYMQGLDHTEIVHHYHTDYPFKIYTNKKDLSIAMVNAAMSVEGTKYKPNILTYKSKSEQHNSKKLYDKVYSTWKIIHEV